MQYTDEQQAVINAVRDFNNIRVFALAGTGKTTTLKAITKEYPELKFLYLAFNRSIVNEAKSKFTDNTEIKTVHALAFRYVGKFYKDRLTGRYDYYQIANALDIDVSFVFSYIKYFEKFLDSDSRLNKKSISQLLKRLGVSKDYRECVTSFIVDLYNAMRDRESDLPITHSFYLKEFELNFHRFKIKNEYDVILLDEAQDTNPVTLSIFNKFNAKKIMVGDRHQKIYGFRGAVNGMECFDADITLHLTYTFRFSKESQVKIANDILYYLKNEDEDKLIKPARKDEVNENDIKDTCIICRTNAQLIEIFSENTNKIKPVRDPKVFFSTIRKIFERKIRTPEYCREFEDYLLALEDLGEKTEDGELLSSVSLIKRFDCDERLFIELYRQANANYKSKDNFSCFITTAHTSKGLEWDKVIIAEDFKTIEDLLGIIEIKDEDKIQEYVSFNDNGKMFVKVPAGELRNFFGKIRSNVIKEELNLLYVAVTRAKKVLSIPSQYHIYNDRVYSAII